MTSIPKKIGILSFRGRLTKIYSKETFPSRSCDIFDHVYISVNICILLEEVPLKILVKTTENRNILYKKLCCLALTDLPLLGKEPCKYKVP